MTGGNEAKHPIRIKATYARIRRPSKVADEAVAPAPREANATSLPGARPASGLAVVRDGP